MTLIIDPPANAIPVYPWVKAQEFYVGIIETVRVAQVAIDPTYDFSILKNRFTPDIEDVTTDKVVNIVFGDITDIQETRMGKEVIVPFDFEFHANAGDESGNIADMIVIERAMYLSAMVEYAITALYNHDDPNITYGQMDRGKIKRSFSTTENVTRSDKLYFGGVLSMSVRFSYSFADYTNLALLEFVKTQISGRVYDININRV